MTDITDAIIVRDLAASAIGIKLAPNGMPVTVMPHGYQLLELPNLLDKPLRLKQHVGFQDLASLVAYYKLFRTPNSRVFADINHRHIKVVFDYHHAAVTEPTDTQAKADWCEHSALYKTEIDPRFQIWRTKNKARMTQTEFAEFIEDNMDAISAPPAADLYELVTNFQVKRDVQFESATRTQSGTVQVTYREQDKGVSTVDIPSELKLLLPVFLNGESHIFQAKFRYRLESGRLSLWYELLNLEAKIMRAFEALIADFKLRTNTDIVFSGTV